MTTTAKSVHPDIPDNHRESWLALLAAADAYCQKSGCDVAILTACKKFVSSAGEVESARKRESGGVAPSGGRKWDFSYHVWGQGTLAEASRRYLDDIGVLHSTTVLTAQRQTRRLSDEGGAKLGVDIPASKPLVSRWKRRNYGCSIFVKQHTDEDLFVLLLSPDGGR